VTDRLAVLPNGQAVLVAAIRSLWDLERRTGCLGCYALEAAPRERDRLMFGPFATSMDAVLLWEASCYQAHGLCEGGER
jgi:hypothetical protein